MNRRERARLLGAGALVALAIVFALVNLARVKVDWIVATTNTPLIVVIGVGFVLGAVTGVLVWRRRG